MAQQQQQQQQQQAPQPVICAQADYNTYAVEPDPACKDYFMQQTMMRIKDPKVSLEFYTKVLGMRYTRRNLW